MIAMRITKTIITPEDPDSDFQDSIDSNEIYDMSLVSDFIDPSNSDYEIIHLVSENITDAVRSKRSTSSSARQVLRIIRDAREWRIASVMADDLGYGDKSAVSVTNPMV